MNYVNYQSGEGREDKKEDRKATKSEDKNLEESAYRTIMRQAWGEGCGGREFGEDRVLVGLR